jgi:hypothetical protein
VVDVWESQEAFEKFSKVLMPIVEKNGFGGGKPVVYPHIMCTSVKPSMHMPENIYKQRKAKGEVSSPFVIP